jgi:hypothetical protein
MSGHRGDTPSRAEHDPRRPDAVRVVARLARRSGPTTDRDRPRCARQRPNHHARRIDDRREWLGRPQAEAGRELSRHRARPTRATTTWSGSLPVTALLFLRRARRKSPRERAHPADAEHQHQRHEERSRATETLSFAQLWEVATNVLLVVTVAVVRAVLTVVTTASTTARARHERGTYGLGSLSCGCSWPASCSGRRQNPRIANPPP